MSASFTADDHHAVRQVATLLSPMTSTSSFDWWPYPSWGASSTAQATSFSNIIAGASVTATAIGSSTTSLQTVIRPAVSATPGTTVSSIIHITALPPANSSSSHNTSKSIAHTSSFNVAYLAPLFAILGIIAGALSTWFILRCFSRRLERRHARELSLEPGPCYLPPSETGTEDMQALTQETASFGHTSTRSVHSDFLGRAISASTRPYGSQLGYQAVLRNAEARRGSSHTPSGSERLYSGEDDPFLDDPSPMATASSSVERQPSGNRFTAALLSPGAIPDEGDDVLYDTLRHKSIRRGILERLKFGTLRRPLETVPDEPDLEVNQAAVDHSPTRRMSHRHGHKRNDSDLNVDDLAEASRHPMATPARTNSATRSAGDESPLQSGPGFRIIEEDTEADALAARQCEYRASRVSGQDCPSGHNPANEDSSWTWLSPWSSSSNKETPSDTYTAMPARRSVAQKRGSPFSTPAASRTSTSVAPPPAMTRVDSSILPSSPPRIMSPPLESMLFFGAVPPDFGGMPALDLRLPAANEKRLLESATKAASSSKQGNKLHTKKEPPLLPFPSSSRTSPYRHRLKKTLGESQSWDTSIAPRPEEDADLYTLSPATSLSPGRQTSAERHKARHAALDKVQEIVSHSWSQRDMSVDLFVGSPTMFGALASDAVRELPRGGGIEQRLQALKAQERQLAMARRSERPSHG